MTFRTPYTFLLLKSYVKTNTGETKKIAKMRSFEFIYYKYIIYKVKSKSKSLYLRDLNYDSFRSYSELLHTVGSRMIIK